MLASPSPVQSTTAPPENSPAPPSTRQCDPDARASTPPHQSSVSPATTNTPTPLPLPDPAPALPPALEIPQTFPLHQSAACSPSAKSPESSPPAPRPVHPLLTTRAPPQRGRDTSQSPAKPAATPQLQKILTAGQTRPRP